MSMKARTSKKHTISLEIPKALHRMTPGRATVSFIRKTDPHRGAALILVLEFHEEQKGGAS